MTALFSRSGLTGKRRNTMDNDKIARELVKVARELVGKRLRIDLNRLAEAVQGVLVDEVYVEGEIGVYANVSGSYYPQTLYSPEEGPELETGFDKWTKKPQTEPRRMSFVKFMNQVADYYGRLPKEMTSEQFANDDEVRKQVQKILAKGDYVSSSFDWVVSDGNMDGSGNVEFEDDSRVKIYGKVSGNTLKFSVKVSKSLEDEVIDGLDWDSFPEPEQDYDPY